MSNLFLFVLLTLACLGAVMYAAPRQLEALQSVGIVLPLSARGVIFQGAFLSTVGTFVGVILSKQTGFVFIALQEFGESNNGQVLIKMAGVTLLATVVAFVGHYIIYYLVFRPRMSAKYVILGERIRLKMGMLARILQGGIVEEVQFRWGAMSAVVWLGLRFVPGQRNIVIWVGIVVAALIFGLFHLAGAAQLGLGDSRANVGLTIIDNALVGIVFGWLFWQYGLLAAIISHALIHVFWFPIEGFHLGRYLEKNKAV